MSLKKLLIVGAGGHGRSVAEAAMLEDKWDVIHFVDDCFHEVETINEVAVVAPLQKLITTAHHYQGIVIAIGNNATRAQLTQQLLNVSLPLVTIIHPSAFVSKFADIGPGCTIMSGATVGANAQLGVGCIVNCNSTVDHDCVLHDFCHLGVGVHLPGGVIMGEGALLQAGASAGVQVEIPAWTVWSVGKAVTQEALDKLCTA
ncbi:NeuD/PglB/VioB family sugar acetyltransferase [Aliidiomarina sp. Khilg15.8]